MNGAEIGNDPSKANQRGSWELGGSLRRGWILPLLTSSRAVSGWGSQRSSFLCLESWSENKTKAQKTDPELWVRRTIPPKERWEKKECVWAVNATDTDDTPVEGALALCLFHPFFQLVLLCVLSTKVLASTNTEHIFWMRIKENVKTPSD